MSDPVGGGEAAAKAPSASPPAPAASSPASSSCCVLYVDHEGHPAPLGECYHATAARRLASSVDDRFPPTTVTGVDSAYCPQCLSFHDAPSAARLGYCPKATCQRCPVCQSIASIATQTNLCYYRCGLCDWTSQECGLTVAVQTDDDNEGGGGGGTTDRLELARAAEDLLGELSKRKSRPTQDLETHFKALAGFWERRQAAASVTTAEGHHRGGSPGGGGGGGSRGRGRKNVHKSSSTAWSVEALETSLLEAKKVADAAAGTTEDVAGIEIARPSLDEDPADRGGAADDEDAEAMYGSVPAFSFRLQSLNTPLPPGTRRDLLPLPVPLRVRQSRRCRAELAEGRPGILLKPKVNPLEGDSSLRMGHGQWWKKDSSAVHVIPQVGVSKNVRVNDDRRVLLLKVTNPTLGSIRLRFAASSYRGERDWDDDGAADGAAPNPVLSELLVDPWTRTRVDAELVAASDPSSLRDLQPTATVELLSAEDSIIEMGSKARQVPDAVANWDAASVAAAESQSSVRLLAHSASSAWFEMVLPGNIVRPNEETTLARRAPAVPLALQIEVGNGSWESSLIQPRPPEGDEPDRVTFDLVLIIGTN